MINNRPDALAGATAQLTLLNLDGSQAAQKNYTVEAAADAATSLGAVEFPAGISAVHFIKLELKDAGGKMISSNFYWHANADRQDDLTDLNTLPVVALEAQVSRDDTASEAEITVTLHNASKTPALMTHVQLRRSQTGERVLPVYYDDNYVSLMPGESQTIHIEADRKQLKGDDALVVVDGWNVTVAKTSGRGASISVNTNAQVDHWPATGLPFQTEGLR